MSENLLSNTPSFGLGGAILAFWINSKKREKDAGLKVLKKAIAMRVVFYYPGEEGTCLENPEVTVYENGIVHLKSVYEETTTHISNCEILWNFQVANDGAEERTPKIRLLRPKADSRDNPTLEQ